MRRGLRYLVAFTVTTALAMSASAQISPYYVTTDLFEEGGTSMWQNGGMQFAYEWQDWGERLICADWVDGCIRQANNLGSGQRGGVYALDGTPTGEHTHFDNDGHVSVDCAFDGTNVYMIDGTTGSLISCDKDFTHIQQLFPVEGAWLTYDWDRGTIWTSSGGGQMYLREYTMEGLLVSEFNIGSYDYLTALAFDPADGTLWGYKYFDTNMHQYNRDGQLLDSYSGPNPVSGGEILPEPASLLMLGLAGVTLLGRRRS